MTETADPAVELLEELERQFRATLQENAQLKGANQRLTMERDEARRDTQGVYSSWQRALGNRIFNKRHLIDALVMTTQWLVANRDHWEVEAAAMKKRRELELMAETLGVPVTIAYDQCEVVFEPERLAR